MRPFKTLPISKLQESFQYHKNGFLIWKTGRNSGKLAGCSDNKGYSIVKINRSIFKIHRIIFAMHHGYWPPLVDHIDRNRANNKIQNLRDIDSQKNSVNTNKTRGAVPFRGVTFNKGAYTASLKFKGQYMYLGRFKTAEEAHQKYLHTRETLNPSVLIAETEMPNPLGDL